MADLSLKSLSDGITGSKNTLADAINGVLTQNNAVQSLVGNPSLLNTSVKTNAVSGINEVNTNLTNHKADTTKHVTKDGVLQKGLNCEMVNGVHFFVSATDPSISNTVNNNDIWVDIANLLFKVRIAGVWTSLGATYLPN